MKLESNIASSPNGDDAAEKPERAYLVSYRLADGSTCQERVLGRGHHEAVAKMREKGATDILHVARAEHASVAVKVKKKTWVLILKVAAVALVTALVLSLLLYV